ncbi:MAG: ABC transporter ATP-binding protein [Chthoniobacterales bacterium]
MKQPPPLPDEIPGIDIMADQSREGETPVISVKELRRSFGAIEAVRGISFNIYAGQVVGFIGANGAGKTTTMRMMSTLEMPTSGQIIVGGHDVTEDPEKVRQHIGWMPDSYGAYKDMTVEEYLDFFARAFYFRRDDRRQRVKEVMEFADLFPIADRLVNKLSKGMGQRLCLGRTLLHDPSVMILDEPAAGLDPKARVEFKRLINLLSQEGKTIFISSHILSELSEMCDTLLFIDEGRIVHHGSAENLISPNQGTVVSVHVAEGVEALAEWVSLNAGVELIETRRSSVSISITSKDPKDHAAILRKMIMDGIPVTEFRRENQRLEDAFINLLTKPETPSPAN